MNHQYKDILGEYAEIIYPNQPFVIPSVYEQNELYQPHPTSRRLIEKIMLKAFKILTNYEKIQLLQSKGKDTLPAIDFKTCAACINILRTIQNPYTKSQYEDLKVKYPEIKKKLESDLPEIIEQHIKSFALNVENDKESNRN